MPSQATRSAAVLDREEEALDARQTSNRPITVDGIEPQPSTGDIAVLAYLLWEQRGCPIGSPEEDWLKAEEQLRAELAAQTE